jgi:thymidine kinase
MEQNLPQIQNPEFIIFTGPMFGGKTTKMLGALERAKYQKKKIILFKPKKDNRYSFGRVMSHTGLSWDAQNVINGDDIIKLANGADIIAVDEAFMIPGCGKALVELFKRGKSIYVSSIQLSANNEPFMEMLEMFPWATKIEVCPAVCNITGLDAYYTVSKQEIKEVHVGGSDVYEPRSFYFSKTYVK